jgi:hypothetical protein
MDDGKEEIQNLTDEQASSAVKLFYDLAPAELWEDGLKPSPERVRSIATGLAELSPEEYKPGISTLVAGDAETGGEIARTLLVNMSESPSLCPWVERAVSEARKPHMCIDPITGTFILVFLLAIPNVDLKKGELSVEPGAGVAKIISALNLPELLDKLPAIIKALPGGVWAKLLGT